MSSRSTAQDTTVESTFNVDRFELVAGERYEVEGRWSGVRGRIFMRPELILTDGNQTQRLLADLAQKPWQAAEGAPWSVAFPCPADPIDAKRVELAVAPDITVPVKRGRITRSRANQGSAAPKPETPATQASPVQAKPQSVRKRRGLGVQLAEAQSELERLRAEQARLSERLDAAQRQAEKAREDALAARAVILGERDDARAERDQAIQERDAAAAERDNAIAERGIAVRQTAVDREAAERSREQAAAELEQVRSELQRALEAVEATAAERDAALRAGVEVERELNAAKSARESLLEDREHLLSQRAWLKGELKRLSAEHRHLRDEAAHGLAEPTQPVVPARLPLASGSGFAWVSAGVGRRSVRPVWHHRAVALVALGVAVIVFVLVLTSVRL